MTWFNENPQWLEQEIEALDNEGFLYVIDEVARSSGHLVITVTYPFEKEKHKLTCVYPSSYPYFAPKVQGPTLPPGRHIDPYSGGLCLFENEQSVWKANDTLAGVLKEQIPKILKEHESAHNPTEVETTEGYQVSGQIPYEPNSVLFTDDWVIPDEVDFGEMSIKFSISPGPNKYLTGYVESFTAGKSSQSSSTPFFENFFDSKLQCRWVKLDTPPASVKGDKVLDEASKINPLIQNLLFPSRSLDIVGLVFKEDSSKDEKVFNWIFVIRRKIKLKKTQKKLGLKPYVTQIIRSDRYTLDNIQKRVPRLKGIAQKKVLVVGAGALGSNVIWQLARAGIEFLTIIDSDIVQVGNIPRWLLGFQAIGKSKAHVISSYLNQSYPHMRCEGIGIHIGAPPVKLDNGTLIDPHELLIEQIRRSDLVIDCTAETNINHYLSSYSRNYDKPYVWASATQGGWGGIIGRVIPEETQGDWIDFAYLNNLGDIPSPAAEEGSDIQPVGCFHPTFTGTGFDLDHVSLMATRVAVATLSRGHGDGYPDFDWDIGILNLWDEQNGTPISPQWSPHQLKKCSEKKK